MTHRTTLVESYPAVREAFPKKCALGLIRSPSDYFGKCGGGGYHPGNPETLMSDETMTLRQRVRLVAGALG